MIDEGGSDMTTQAQQPTYGLYVRVSSQAQADSGTHESQIAAIRDRVARDKLKVFKPDLPPELTDEAGVFYVDAGVSAEGVPLWEREAGKRLFEDGQAGRFDRVMVTDLDRLIRMRLDSGQKARERGTFTGWLLDHQITVETCYGETIDPRDVLADIKLSLTGEDNRKKSERSRRGKRSAAAAGCWQGGEVPFGYRLELQRSPGSGKHGARSVLVVNKEQAGLVRWMFEQHVDSHSPYAIAKMLEARGERKPPNKKRPDRKSDLWRPVDISRILGSETYVGRWHFNKAAYRENPKTKKRERYVKPKSDWIEAPVPPIIDEDMFRKVQLGLEAGRQTQGTRTDKTEFLLNKTLFCAVCRDEGRGPEGEGRMLYHQRTAKVDGRVRCYGGWDRFGGHCTAPTHKISVIDERVCRKLHRFLVNADRIQAIWDEQFRPDQRETYEEELERLVKQKSNLEAQAARADHAFVTGHLTEARYVKQVDRIDEEGQLLDREIATLESKLAGCQQAEELKANFAHAFTFAAEGILALAKQDVPHFLDPEGAYTNEERDRFHLRKAVIQSCVDRVYVSPGGDVALDVALDPGKLADAVSCYGQSFKHSLHVFA